MTLRDVEYSRSDVAGDAGSIFSIFPLFDITATVVSRPGPMTNVNKRGLKLRKKRII